MKSKPTTVNKITRPTLPKVFPRTRLFRRLDQARRFPITWISGPPGSGKTTLIASYLDQRKLPCLWYRVDEGDEDLATFFYYLGLAGQKANPRSKKPLPLLTPEYQFGIPTFTRRYFEALYQRLKPPYILVFDNYQTIPAESPFHEIIRNGFSETPRGIQVIIISRGDPAQAFTRLRANNLLHTLDWEELRLTPPELKGMVKLHDKKPVSQNTLQHLLEKTQGWTAGVVLLEKMRAETLGPSILNSRMPEVIFNYFAGEVFDRTDQEMQAFLLKTACLPRMTPLMAEQLTGNHLAGRILADLNRKNYFVEKRSHPELTYQFHALFREFLQKQAEQEFPTVVRAQLQFKAAKLLEESNQIEDALELFIEIRDWKSLIQLALKQAESLLAQGRNKTLEGWLRQIPLEMLDRDPRLLYWLGMSLLLFRPKESILLFEKAYTLFSEVEDAAGIFLTWSGVVDSIYYQFERFDRFAPWLNELGRVMKKYDRFPTPEIELRVTLSMLSVLNQWYPHHPDAFKWRERMAALAGASQDLNLQAIAALHAAWYELFGGHLSRSIQILDSFEKIVKNNQIVPFARFGMQLISSIHCWMHGLNEQCQNLIAEILQMAENSGVYMWNYQALGHGFIGALSSGAMEKAQALLNRMEAGLAQAGDLDKTFYYYLAAWQAVMRHDLALALESLEKGWACNEKLGASFPIATFYLGKAVVYHELKDRVAAGRQFELARHKAHEMRSPMLLFMCHLAAAQMAFDYHKEAEGIEALRRAMAVGREQGFLNSYWWRADIMSRLCAKALEYQIETAYVQNLVRERGLMPDILPVHIESWPWPVKIYTLGKFEVVLDDRPIQFPRKTPKKLLEALKVLIASGNKGIGLPQLADTLWPQADGDLANQSLVKTLNRLRHLIGHKEIFLASEGRLVLNPKYCWVDAWAFERMLAEAEQDKQTQEDNRLFPGHLEKALDLYAGMFLPDDSGQPWADAKRERLRNKFIRCLEKLGRHWEHAGDPEKAITFYLQGLETDDLAEEFYRHLMAAYAQMGRRTEAIRIYQRCEKTFAIELGVAPSAQTKDVYEALVKPL